MEEISSLDTEQVNHLFTVLAEKLYLDKMMKQIQCDKEKKEFRKSFASLSVYTTDSVEEKEKKCCNV